MTKCCIHTGFFDETCTRCKKEYSELKGLNELNFYYNTSHSNNNVDNDINRKRKYKEFTEERAKKLYEELILQYLKKSCNEKEAAEKAIAIIRKQCRMRDMPFWSWI